MNHDTDDDVPPPLSSDAQQFLFEHAATGTPSAAELARVRARLGETARAAGTATSEAAPGAPADVVRLHRPAVRRWLPPEGHAVAAVLAVAVVAQLVYVAVRPPPELPAADGGAPGGVEAVLAAYRAGDVKGAQRLAASSCTDANCASMSAKLLRALALTARFEALSKAELDELAVLDASLSGGVQTELTVAIAKRRSPAGELPGDPERVYAEARALDREGKSAEALEVARRCPTDHRACAELRERLLSPARRELEALVAEISALRKSQDLDLAARRGEDCVRKFPGEATCHRLLGTIFASRASRDESMEDLERAKRHYERFLELAPPEDEYVPKVKALLDAADEANRRAGAVESDWELQLSAARSLAQTDPQAAMQKVAVLMASTSDPKHEREAKALLSELERGEVKQESDPNELYLRGYVLRESDPDAAAALFRRVLELSPETDTVHQKALSRLRELKAEPAPAEVVVKRGKSFARTFPQGLARVAVGDPEVADVQLLDPKTLRITGVSVGATTLMAWLGDGTRVTLLVRVAQ